MKKALSLLSLAVLTVGLLGSCSKINERIDGVEKRVESIENEKIASIENQIAAINSSIADLGQIRSDISSLKQSAVNHGQDISELQKADETLKNRIDNLEDYLDGTLTKFAEKDWAIATFATLEQLNATKTSLSALEGKVNKLGETFDGKLSDLKTELTNSINNAIAGVNASISTLEARVSALEAMIQSVSITPAYSDGSVEAVDSILTLKCIVSPAEALLGMESLKDSLLIYADSVKVKTKAGTSAYMEIKVSEAAVTDTAQGAITLKANISEYLPKGEDKALTVAVNIKNGISDFTTEFVPVTVAAAKPIVEYVEIGGVKWATKNLGAEKVTDSGDYFAWGETAPYYEGTGGWPATPTWKSGKASGYAWQSYCGSSSFSEWSTPPYDATTKILKPEFDAATQILGEGWRMPTKEEFQALYDACLNGSYDTSTNPSGASASVGKGVYWCTNYDGVAGCLFCDGTNKLFFPAAGYGGGMALRSAGVSGYYWSSSLGTDSPNCAYYLLFDAGSAGTNYRTRYYGKPIRPVKAAPAPLPAGALKGVFSVSATKKVYFSKGNLVATIDASGAPTAWKFAAHQYDCLGEGGANKTIGATAGDVDLFGWSTSTNGGTSTTDNYGIKTSTTASDYSGDFYDWGKAVGDGNTWRTLSKDEWTYLFDNHSKLWATVNGVKGYVIAPDGFEGTLSNTYADDAALAANNLVFLPAAGYRNGSRVSDVGDVGYCWSSTAGDGGDAYVAGFGSTVARPVDLDDRYRGHSVRLITECQ